MVKNKDGRNEGERGWGDEGTLQGVGTGRNEGVSKVKDMKEFPVME